MTEQEKSEIVGLMSGVMQKFATEYIQPQFTALQNDIDTKHSELKQEIADVRTELRETRAELKQDIADVRQELRETRQELKSEIQKTQRDNAVVTHKVDELMAWKRDLTDACIAHPEEALEATG